MLSNSKKEEKDFAAKERQKIFANDFDVNFYGNFNECEMSFQAAKLIIKKKLYSHNNR